MTPMKELTGQIVTCANNLLIDRLVLAAALLGDTLASNALEASGLHVNSEGGTPISYARVASSAINSVRPPESRKANQSTYYNLFPKLLNVIGHVRFVGGFSSLGSRDLTTANVSVMHIPMEKLLHGCAILRPFFNETAVRDNSVGTWMNKRRLATVVAAHMAKRCPASMKPLGIIQIVASQLANLKPLATPRP